jgi:hypothetical protein
MPKHTLPNGIVIDSGSGAAPVLQRRVEYHGLEHVRVWLATHPDGTQNYLISEEDRPVFESQKVDEVWAKLDMMHSSRTAPN